MVIDLYGTELLRYKGLFNIANDDHRWGVQCVHMLLGGEQGSAWKPDEKRESVMVFIGKGLPQKAIETGLDKCLA